MKPFPFWNSAVKSPIYLLFNIIGPQRLPASLQFYLNLFLTINFPDSAVSRFSNVSPVSSLSQDASWYLGLSYLKAGNSQKAAGVFESITKMQKHYKKEQAKEIFRQLSNMK
jgi:hypothetical protein